MAFKFAKLNANVLRDANKHMGFLQWLSHFSFDIVCLQESHIVSLEECNRWFLSFGILVCASCGSSQSCGTVVLFRSVFSLLSTSCDTNGRFAVCDLLYRDKRFRVISLYAPNTNPQKDDFFAYVASMVDLSVPSILCGDFNAVFNCHLDRLGSSSLGSARDSSVSLRALFQEYCVVDA